MSCSVQLGVGMGGSKTYLQYDHQACPSQTASEHTKDAPHKLLPTSAMQNKTHTSLQHESNHSNRSIIKLVAGLRT